jgi:hypothetical protein
MVGTDAQLLHHDLFIALELSIGGKHRRVHLLRLAITTASNPSPGAVKIYSEAFSSSRIIVELDRGDLVVIFQHGFVVFQFKRRRETRHNGFRTGS